MQIRKLNKNILNNVVNVLLNGNKTTVWYPWEHWLQVMMLIPWSC